MCNHQRPQLVATASNLSASISQTHPLAIIADENRKHVLQDLQPYICTYEDCATPHQLFSSRDEWLHHIGWNHSPGWCCDATDHEPRMFSSEKLLEAHLRSHHTAAFTEQQLPALIENSKRPSLVPFTACPLCNSYVHFRVVFPQHWTLSES